MILGRYRQQPGEKRKRQLDYTDFLETDETITTVTATVTPEEDDPDDAFEVPSIVIDPDGKLFAYFTQGGVAGKTYSVEFLITTSGGQRKEDTVEFDVEEDT